LDRKSARSRDDAVIHEVETVEIPRSEMRPYVGSGAAGRWEIAGPGQVVQEARLQTRLGILDEWQSRRGDVGDGERMSGFKYG